MESNEKKVLTPEDAIDLIAEQVEKENPTTSNVADVQSMSEMISKMTKKDALALKEKLFPSSDNEPETQEEQEQEQEQEEQNEDREGDEE